MCGIVGMVSSSSKVDLELLAKMRDTMEHRGPDSAGIWGSEDGCVGLGHRRLAILDLSSRGNQPMADQSGQLRITFNGEIYNYQELRAELEERGHRFATASDTEVILEAYREWGTECLSSLDGMFAFALFDSKSRCLFIARDRAGEKPLYYRYASGMFAFSSELKALMANPNFPRQIDVVALQDYLAYGYVTGTRCILKSYHKLPQGHAGLYDIATGSLKIWSYWQLPEPSDAKNWDTEDLVQELESLLIASVRRQLEADVPVGILLSGGLDSSLVAAAAAHVSSNPVKTFTISFPGHGTMDESCHAHMVADHFGTRHTTLPAEPAGVDLLPALAKQYDEPIADSSMLPTFLVSRLICSEAKVALGGDGGDELFGGYLLYSQMEAQQRIGRLLPQPVSQVLRSCVEYLWPIGLTGRNYLLKQTADLKSRIAFPYVFDKKMRIKLLSPLLNDMARDIQVEEQKKALCNAKQTLLQQVTTVDFRTYLVDDILVKVDRASMLNSLECRAPWLDYHMVEFAFGRVPDELRMHQGQRKILPRLLAERLLPPELDLSRKQGFGIPLRTWFKGEWGNFVSNTLQEASSDIFDRRFIDRLLAAQNRGLNHTERLFALTMFELWRREYRVSA
jgi:asparagine synthase (glutamine-hydrolysing)